ncbi:MAG: carbohydrate kinase family protein, partial [Lentisphaeria bacterium]|nr:carbohydrate kinase family protein [Lentisphaeria bacterium]
MPRVFGFGSATLHFRLRPAGTAPDPRDLLAGKVAAESGGNTADSLVQAARLGTHANWLGKLGDDWIARRILADLEEETVDCSAAILDPAACSPLRLVVDQPQGQTIRLPNSLATLKPDELDFLAGQVGEGDWTLVEIGEIPLPIVLAFCQRLRRRGGRILLTLDLDPIRQIGADPVDLQFLLSQADLLVPRHHAVRTLCETDNPEIMAADLARRHHCLTVIRTPHTAWYAAPTGLADEFPADLPDPDAPGSGEAAVRGARLAALAQGRSLPAALRLAHPCAARAAA